MGIDTPKVTVEGEYSVESGLESAALNEFVVKVRALIGDKIRRLLGTGGSEARQKIEIVEGLSAQEKNLLVKLFPEGIEMSHFSQMNTGNCYLLAALHVLKRHPIAPYIFSSIVREIDGGWEVKFPGEDKAEFVPTKDLDGRDVWDEENNKWVFKGTVEGQLGDKILVLAHAKWRKRKMVELEQRDKPAARDTMLASEGGWAKEPLALFLKDKVLKHYDIGSTFKVFNESDDNEKEVIRILDDFARNPRDCILTVATPMHKETPYYRDAGREFGRKMYYMDKDYRFVTKHAYSLVAVDAHRRVVTVANPHSTKSSEYNLTYEEFLEYFSILEGVKLDPRKVKGVEFMQKDFVDGVLGQELQSNVNYQFLSDELKIINLGDSARYSVEQTGGDVLRLNLLDANNSVVVFGELQKDKSIILGRNSYPSLPNTVSALHVKVLNLGGGKFLVTDLNSTNGTTVV